MRRRWVWLAIFLGIAAVSYLAALHLKGRHSIKKPASSAQALFNQAKEQENKGKLLKSKELYSQFILEFPNDKRIQEAQENLEDLNIRIIFSKFNAPQSQIYKVKPGDTLTQIAQQFNTTVELIKKSNNLSSDKILPGENLRIWKGKFSLLIDKSQNSLILKSDEEIIKTYLCSTGKDNFTPVGSFKIATKLINPSWKGIPYDDPRNILGSRWMGFSEPFNNYGIHGTTQPESIGKNITEGCIRMLNEDVEELYSILPIGTEVTIID